MSHDELIMEIFEKSIYCKPVIIVEDTGIVKSEENLTKTISLDGIIIQDNNLMDAIFVSEEIFGKIKGHKFEAYFKPTFYSRDFSGLGIKGFVHSKGDIARSDFFVLNSIPTQNGVEVKVDHSKSISICGVELSEQGRQYAIHLKEIKNSKDNTKLIIYNRWKTVLASVILSAILSVIISMIFVKREIFKLENHIEIIQTMYHKNK